VSREGELVLLEHETASQRALLRISTVHILPGRIYKARYASGFPEELVRIAIVQSIKVKARQTISIVRDRC